MKIEEIRLLEAYAYYKVTKYDFRLEKEHKLSSLKDFMILGTNYKKNKFRRKISEPLYIKEKRSLLNIQEKSVPLILFNWVDNLAGPNQMCEMKFIAKIANVFGRWLFSKKASF